MSDINTTSTLTRAESQGSQGNGADATPPAKEQVSTEPVEATIETNGDKSTSNMDGESSQVDTLASSNNGSVAPPVASPAQNTPMPPPAAAASPAPVHHAPVAPVAAPLSSPAPVHTAPPASPAQVAAPASPAPVAQPPASPAPVAAPASPSPIATPLPVPQTTQLEVSPSTAVAAPTQESSPPKNDPQKRRNSYKDVESRLFQSTAATINGKWNGNSPPPSAKSRKSINPSTPIESTDGAASATPESNRTPFKDVSSRLHDTTTATTNGKWNKTPTTDTPEKPTDLPLFSTSTRRASLGDLVVPMDKDMKTAWKDPAYKDTQSRLLLPTSATTNGKWNKPTTDSDENPVVSTPEKNSSSGPSPDKNRRRFSTSFLPTEISECHQDLAVGSGVNPYENTKPRLHMMTASVKNAKWNPEKDCASPRSSGADSPAFKSTFAPAAGNDFASSPRPLPLESSSQYKDITSRLHESTVANTQGKYAPPPLDAQPPNFQTNIRRTSLVGEEFATPPPVPESKKYKNVESRLHAPTTAYLESSWKKETENRKSMSPSPIEAHPLQLSPAGTPSRLLRPTVSSTHHVWPLAVNAPPTPPTEGGHPHIIKSMKYENVESRLLCPTTSYLAKFTVQEDDGLPKEAFGHPIEPEYIGLIKAHPTAAAVPLASPRSRGSSPPQSPSR